MGKVHDLLLNSHFWNVFYKIPIQTYHAGDFMSHSLKVCDLSKQKRI